MKKLIILIALVSVTSWAHVEIGTYQGVTRDGKPCAIKANSVTFVDDVKEPLNERVEIQVDALKMSLQHLPQVNPATSEVGFDHDHLTGVLANKANRIAIVLTMDHTEGHDGPSKLELVVYDKANTEQSVTLTCSELKYVGK